MIKKSIFFIKFILIYAFLPAQFNNTFFFNENFQVKSASGNYKTASLGGLEAPSFNVLDIDKDGLKDLVLFDRAGSRTIVFINKGTKTQPIYTHKANYEKNIPPINSWFLMRDMDADGKDDLVTLSIYEVHQASNDLIYYKDTGILEVKFGKAIFVENGKTSSHLSFNPISLPSITDIDNDGDMDILDVALSEGQGVLYKNFAVEENNKTSSKYFRIVDFCWGNFIENAFVNEVFLNPVGCSPDIYPKDTFPWLLYQQKGDSSVKGNNKTGGSYRNIRRHGGGSSLLLLDRDEDDDYDLIMGNAGFDNLIFLQNGKNSIPKVTDFDTIVKQDTNFPSETLATRFAIFPAAYYLDVDGDDIKDLVAAPCQIEDNSGKNQMWYYKNNGLNNKPDFKLVKKNFIQENMLDLGSSSKPVFADIDGDGDEDMFISIRDNLKDGDGICRLYFYENKGDKGAPSFVEVNTDFGGLMSKKLKFLSPSFADIDGDGDFDMFIGTEDGEVMYYSNTGSNKVAQYSLIKDDWQGIRVNTIATPTFYDVDKDNDLDLIIGQGDGHMSYYKNTGTIQTATMTFITDSLGKMKTAPYIKQGPDYVLSNLGNSTPSITSFGTDTLYLISGAENGTIRSWKLDMTHPFDSFSEHTIKTKYKVYTNNVIDYKIKTNELYTTLVDINADGKDDIVAGCKAGGLFYWSSFEPTTGLIDKLSLVKEYKMYPNPAKNRLMFRSKKSIQKVEIITTLGQKIKIFNAQGTSLNLDISDIKNGTYFIRIVDYSHQVWNEQLMINRLE